MTPSKTPRLSQLTRDRKGRSKEVMAESPPKNKKHPTWMTGKGKMKDGALVWGQRRFKQGVKACVGIPKIGVIDFSANSTSEFVEYHPRMIATQERDLERAFPKCSSPSSSVLSSPEPGVGFPSPLFVDDANNHITHSTILPTHGSNSQRYLIDYDHFSTGGLSPSERTYNPTLSEALVPGSYQPYQLGRNLPSIYGYLPRSDKTPNLYTVPPSRPSSASSAYSTNTGFSNVSPHSPMSSTQGYFPVSHRATPNVDSVEQLAIDPKELELVAKGLRKIEIQGFEDREIWSGPDSTNTSYPEPSPAHRYSSGYLLQAPSPPTKPPYLNSSRSLEVPRPFGYNQERPSPTGFPQVNKPYFHSSTTQF